ncbi:hypothetical protein [Ruegeria sp.]|uniref:hypothetical protein n=1 Tax=Ruegeria sp. TaxID=1879320 RepID=UPI003AFFE4F0
MKDMDMEEQDKNADPGTTARAALLERLSRMEDVETITEAVTTALIETGAKVEIPQLACGIVEIQLHGLVAHGGDLSAACLAWLEAARAVHSED